jgi:pimeloyl-ACP methyl ester carboxylesterase
MTTASMEDGVLETPSGRRIGWQLLGPPDGEPVAYLHGQPGSRKDTFVFEQNLARFGRRFLSVDRGGYGDTDVAGLDRRDVAQDLLTVADELGIASFPVLAASMGGVYALALAAMAPDRIQKVVLVSGHVLPYDDPDVIARLSPAEQDDLRMLAGGPTPELEAAYAASAASIGSGAAEAIRGFASSWSEHERHLVKGSFADVVGASIEFGLAAGSAGYLEDGLRTLRPLEFDLQDVRCAVRAIHGTADDLEPFANLERLAAQLDDVVVLALQGLGHFGPWLWPELILSLLDPEG